MISFVYFVVIGIASKRFKDGFVNEVRGQLWKGVQYYSLCTMSSYSRANISKIYEHYNKRMILIIIKATRKRKIITDRTRS